jgi:hypothetical protein
MPWARFDGTSERMKLIGTRLEHEDCFSGLDLAPHLPHD